MKKKLFQRGRTRGQLSIFAAIIFQALFILFAMSLNIALVVHDKINLQNSLDLAAYYGAMKQAEILNTIAHINFQIRQSWKLMTWRTKVLGTLGSTEASPSIPSIRPVDKMFAPDTYTPGRYEPGPYVTCVGSKGWKLLPNDHGTTNTPPVSSNADNLCNQLDERIQPLSIPQFPGVLGGFGNILRGVQNQMIQGNKDINNKCKTYGYNSWFLAFFSVVYLQRDQSAKKLLIYKLAELLAKGQDLDGQSIEDGAFKTFDKNLSFINRRSSSDFRIYSSLQGKSPSAWLEDKSLPALPLYAYMTGQ